MGEFKDKYGKSRAGALLANLGKSDLLEKAGAALKNVANGNYFDALKSVISNDESISDVDRENLLLAMENERKMFFAESEQITSWQKSDMKSDSWLAKNARPLTLLSLLVNFYFIMWADSIQEGLIDVKPAYISMLEILLMTVIVAYFGSRGFSKWDERRAANGNEPIKLNPFEKLRKR